MATNNRTFGEAVKRQTVGAEFKQYFLEKFLDNKWWQKILIIVAFLAVVAFFAAYAPVVILIAISIIPLYIPVYLWVARSRRKHYDFIIIPRIKDKKITKEVKMDDDFDLKIETIASKSDAFDIYMAPTKLFSTASSKNTIQEINTIVRKTSDGRTVHIAESMSSEDYEDGGDEEILLGRKTRRAIVLRGTANESYGNIAILRAVNGVTMNVNPKFDKTIKMIEKNGLVEPEIIGELRKIYSEAMDYIEKANDNCMRIQEEIGVLPFTPIDVNHFRDSNERAFVVGVANWKGDWVEKMHRALKYHEVAPETLMPSILHMIDRANVVDTELTQIEMFQHQRNNKNVLNMLGDFLTLLGWDPKEVKRMMEREATQKGLVVTTDLNNEITGNDDGEAEEEEQ